MLETEVKFYLIDPENLRRRLRRCGALSRGRVFETNYRFDNADHQLLSKRSLLRLRRDRRNVLTFKNPHPSGGRQFKIHDELEIEVSDFDTTCQILEALGFSRVQVYEKHRETYEMESVEICLDQLPFGHFVEIEGQPETIPSVAARLDLPWRSRILTNYLEIFETIRRSLKLPFRDITFAHFQALRTDWAALIRQFEAEPPP
jgi:adenylate cyclase class 2